MTSTLADNLRGLAERDPALARRLVETRPRPDIVLLPSRAGLPVPAHRAGGRAVPFHSLVDPRSEGRRWSQACPGEGFCLALGLGGGYHLADLAARPDISRLLIVETDLPLLRSVLEGVDLRSLLGDSRTRLLAAPGPAEVRRAVLDAWLPAVEGRLHVVPLRPALELDPAGYAALAEEARSLADAAADDYAVQARFGGRWFANTLRNLERAQGGDPPLPRAPRALVTGAGPSLEEQVGELRRLRKGAILIATDTSLPAILGHDLIPDLVVSIDCQAASLHHFLQGLPRQTTLVLDLASPPPVARLGRRALFFASGHPFSRYLDGAWRRFLRLDTSGGNVSHAAVSLASLLGAGQIHLFGMDFSYPGGKSYARGTYLYAHFAARAQRLQPLEEHFYSFLMRSPALRREQGAAGLRYLTPQLSRYRQRLERLLGEIPAEVHPAAGRGLPIRVPSRGPAQTGPAVAAPPPAAGLSTAAPDWRRFLRAYRESLAALSAPQHPLGAWLDRLPPSERALWLTLLPSAATLRERSARDPGRPCGGAGLLSRVREWAGAEIGEVLGEGQGAG